MDQVKTDAVNAMQKAAADFHRKNDSGYITAKAINAFYETTLTAFNMGAASVIDCQSTFAQIVTARTSSESYRGKLNCRQAAKEAVDKVKAIVTEGNTDVSPLSAQYVMSTMGADERTKLEVMAAFVTSTHEALKKKIVDPMLVQENMNMLAVVPMENKEAEIFRAKLFSQLAPAFLERNVTLPEIALNIEKPKW